MRPRSDLDSLLASLAAPGGQEPAPEQVPAALMAEFDAALGPASAGRSRLAWFPALAAAACLAIALVLLAPSPQPAAPRQLAFVPIPYVAPLAPYERPQVVRMAVPMMALMAAGFEVHTPDAAGSVTADVLVGQDGRPLAIRLLPDSDRNRRYQE